MTDHKHDSPNCRLGTAIHEALERCLAFPDGAIISDEKHNLSEPDWKPGWLAKLTRNPRVWKIASGEELQVRRAPELAAEYPHADALICPHCRAPVPLVHEVLSLAVLCACGAIYRYEYYEEDMGGTGWTPFELAPPTPVDPAVWRGTSNRHRSVARLPEGKTGLEALAECAPDAHKRLVQQIEQQAADTFRRLYADRVEGCHRELTAVAWAAFKRAGGQQSW